MRQSLRVALFMSAQFPLSCPINGGMPMSTWEEVLRERPAEEYTRILEVVCAFEESGAFGHYTMRNLMADRFISRTAIEQFVDLFLRQTLPFDLENLQREYIRVCHDNPFCGSEIGL